MREVVILAFDGVQILDVAGPMEVFDEATHFVAGAAPYRIRCLGIGPGLGSGVVRASNGLRLAVESGDALPAEIDTLIVPGGGEADLARLINDPACLRWLDDATMLSRRIASICTGALLLAATGLLDGRRATTHWGALGRLREAAPGARVEPDALFTCDGPIHTSAGVTAGIDLSLAMVEQDLGRGVATGIARHLVLYLRRPGGQSQFSAPLRAQAQGAGRIASIVDHVVACPDADLSVDALAARAAMSPRHFARAFKDEMGETPARFVSRSRLEAARVYLAESALPIKGIAARCGFASADVLSRRFRDRFGVTPQDYRRAFGA